MASWPGISIHPITSVGAVLFMPSMPRDSGDPQRGQFRVLNWPEPLCIPRNRCSHRPWTLVKLSGFALPVGAPSEITCGAQRVEDRKPRGKLFENNVLRDQDLPVGRDPKSHYLVFLLKSWDGSRTGHESGRPGARGANPATVVSSFLPSSQIVTKHGVAKT